MSGLRTLRLDAQCGPIVIRSIYSILLAGRAKKTKVQRPLTSQEPLSPLIGRELVVVRVRKRDGIMEEMLGTEWCLNRFERERFLPEVEAIRKIIPVCISIAERWEGGESNRRRKKSSFVVG